VKLDFLSLNQIPKVFYSKVLIKVDQDAFTFWIHKPLGLKIQPTKKLEQFIFIPSIKTITKFLQRKRSHHEEGAHYLRSKSCQFEVTLLEAIPLEVALKL